MNHWKKLRGILDRRRREKSKRGGPIATPEDQKLEIVRGWLEVKGKMRQEDYAATRGVSVSTLRRWERELRQQKKL